MPAPLFAVNMEDIPGVGGNMAKRLYRAGIFTTEQLYAIQPKHMRKLWGNVTGKRMWYALHGYDIQAPASKRGMFGHGHVLPSESRSISGATEISRLLLTKAARRMRRENFYASDLWLWLSIREGSWMGKRHLPVVHDDQAILSALAELWEEVDKTWPHGLTIFRVGVTLYDLSNASEHQLDLLNNDDRQRRRWEAASTAIDNLNSRYAATVVSLGEWRSPKGGHAGGKISYTRIPSAEDFW